MKLTKEHIGKKMRNCDWVATNTSGFFIPLAQSSQQLWVGEDEFKNIVTYIDSINDWEFFEEPKQEIELWSVWENTLARRTSLVFILDVGETYFEFFSADGLKKYFILRNSSEGENFLKYYKPRPDLEVVAPCILEFHNKNLRLSSEYINVEKFLKGKDMYIPFNHFKWPASLALCQIMEKKI